MAMTPEKKVKAQVTKILNEYEAYYFYPATGGFGRSGVPDIIVCFRGAFLGIECKAGDNTATALQLRELDKITKANGYAMIVNEHNISDVRGILDLINETSYTDKQP